MNHQNKNSNDQTFISIELTSNIKSNRNLNFYLNFNTNIQIKLDFINAESVEKFVEKGWDEEKQMYYYLVYFNKEQKS